MKRKWTTVAGAILAVCLVAGLSVWYYIGTRGFMENMGALASEKASDALGVRTDVGTVRVDSLRSLTIEDIALFDKRGQEILKAESAKVGFSFFGVLGNDPVKAVDTVEVHKVRAGIEKRKDGSWNYEDLLSEDSEKSTFAGRVILADSELALRMDGKELTASELNGSVDFADADAMKTEVKGIVEGSEFSAEGIIGDDIRMSVDAANIDIEKYLSWIPSGTMPDSVKIRQGRVDKLSAVIQRMDGEFSANGKADISRGEVEVLGTEIKDIKGLAEISGKTVRVFLGAVAAEQRASVHGKIFLDGEEPRLNLVAESQSFDPSRILKESPYHGAVAFTANINGTPSNPSVEGELSAKSGEVYGYEFSNALVRAAYEDGRIVLRSLGAEVFGGKAEAAGEFEAESMAFNGHVKLHDVEAAGLGELSQGFSGRVSADLGIAGVGSDTDMLSVYGSASAKEASYNGIGIPQANGSFYFADNNVIIDYASVQLDNGGEIGIEGTINDMDFLNLMYYANHVDLSIAQKFEPVADMSGFADFDGTIRGPVENPFVNVRFAGVKGKLFEQPYDSFHGTASGSLDGVSIDSFSMEREGEVHWLAKGTIGFTGARRINLQVDTMDVRMEDIAALVAPDQPITGNVDNIITVTGTLDDPDIVGYIHFDRGSYNGYLLSGMDGDYTMKNGVMTLQDFHIFSPLVDMDLNGTVVPKTKELNLIVEAHDIDMKRFSNELPYPVSGHGKFSGRITGTITAPAFDGELTASELVFNEQTISNVHGDVTLRGKRLVLEPFQFEQNGGTYLLKASANLATERLDGRLEVKNGDINALMAIANVKNAVVHGRINGTIDLAGSLSNPQANASVYMQSGDIAGYAVTNTYLNGVLSNRVISLERFEGEQGTGRFAAVGTVDLDGAIDGRFSAQNIDAGMLPAAAGLNTAFKGVFNIEAQFGGTVNNPQADASVEITSGGVGTSAFDSMTGLFQLRGPVIEVKQFVVQKLQAGRLYKASAYGMVPLRALTSNINDELADYDHMNLTVSLDNGDLGLLPVLSDEVDWAVGETQGNIVIGGSLAEPSVTGSINIKDGSVKLKALAVPFTELNLGLDFAGDKFTIADGRGRLGSGKFTLSGSTRIDGQTPVDYWLKLDADKLDIQSSFFRGPLTAKLELGEGVIYGHHMPKLTLDAKIDNCTISIPTIPESEGELPGLILDVGIEVGKHTHFYSPSLYDIWLQGNVHYGGTTRYPAPSGSISVRRGTVTYLQTIFKIRQGEAYFNQVNSFLPSLSFNADARLSRTKVFLGIEGPLEAMELKLSSSPEMSRAEILKLLTLRGASMNGQDTSNGQWAALLGAGLQMSFLGDIEDTVRNFLQLDELVITQDEFGKSKKEGDNRTIEGYNVKIGKYISDKVMLEYTQGINQNVKRFTVRYDFDDRLSVFAGRREGNDNVVGFEGRISF